MRLSSACKVHCWVFVFAVGLLRSRTPSAEESSPKIGAIRVVRKEIFDISDSTKLRSVGSLVNAVHFLTREQVIRNELLLREGDVFDPALVEESERNLRRTGIVGDIRVRVDTVNRRTADLYVETHDKWTLSLNVSYKQDGGVRGFSSEVGEDNFLGSAQRFEMEYNYRSDRTDPHGGEVRFHEPKLFNTHWRTTVQFKNSEDLQITTFLLDRPFYAERASWSGGVYLDRGTVRRRLYENKLEVSREDAFQENQNGWFVGSFGDEIKIRAGASLQRVRTDSPGGLLRRDDNLDLMTFSLGVLQRRWRKETFLNSLVRIEDVPYGWACDLVGGKNMLDSPMGSASYFFQLNAVATTELADRWYVSPRVSYSGYTATGAADETTLQWHLLAHRQLSHAHLLVLSAQSTIGSAWSPGRQLTLGSPTGLRGYPAYFLSGNRTVLMNIEHRMHPDLEWWIFHIGTALFVDCGTAWKEGEDVVRQRFYSSAGFGLRVENAKQQGSGVIRLDVAFNLDRNAFSEIIITSSQLLSAFNALETAPPNAR